MFISYHLGYTSKHVAETGQTTYDMYQENYLINSLEPPQHAKMETGGKGRMTHTNNNNSTTSN